METKTRVHNFIGGEHVSPTDGGFYDLINPATGEAYAQAPASGNPRARLSRHP